MQRRILYTSMILLGLASVACKSTHGAAVKDDGATVEDSQEAELIATLQESSKEADEAYQEWAEGSQASLDKVLQDLDSSTTMALDGDVTFAQFLETVKTAKARADYIATRVRDKEQLMATVDQHIGTDHPETREAIRVKIERIADAMNRAHGSINGIADPAIKLAGRLGGAVEWTLRNSSRARRLMNDVHSRVSNFNDRLGDIQRALEEKKIQEIIDLRLPGN